MGVIERGYRWCRRRPVIGGMAAAPAALLIAVPLLLAGLLAQEVHAREKVQAAEQARTRQLFDALVNEAAARRSSPRVGRGFRALDPHRRRPRSRRRAQVAGRGMRRDLRSEAMRCHRCRSKNRVGRSLGGCTAGTRNGAVSSTPRTTTSPWISRAPCWSAGRATTGSSIVFRSNPRFADKNWVWLSPDNRFVSSQTGEKLVVWQVDGEAPSND